ncbi:MAG: hypothetical protein ACOYMN_13000 [Roseimicrobium sp.]
MPSSYRPTGETQLLQPGPAGEADLFSPSRAADVPADSVALNDSARFLAGMGSLGGQDAFSELRAMPEWRAHAERMDALWRDFTLRHARHVSAWADAALGGLRRSRAVFYPFSGPDFVFAHLFYPYSDTYVMCGLEPCEALPQWSTLSPGDVASGCNGLYAGLDTVLQFSYFITKEMRSDFQSTRFRGVLPVFLVFLARTGHAVESVEGVRLDASGAPSFTAAGTGAPGLHIRFRGAHGSKSLFYFQQDLANGGCSPKGPFLQFVSSLGRPAAMAKSASYLMHEPYFSNIRNFIVTHCSGIAQDPSGVPYRSLAENGWRVSLYGNYVGARDPFEKYEQPALIDAYTREGGHPLSFGIGYLTEPQTTSLMVAWPE